MGTSKKQSKKYKPPLRIWDKTRINRDLELRSKYGFKNKKELWKAESVLRNIRKRARDLVGLKALNLGKEEEKEFVRKLHSMGLVKEDATVDDVLDLKLEDILNRRLQTIILKKALARSIKEARQIITHRHIEINGKVVDTPSYIIKRDEEDKINFIEKSPLASAEHPVRAGNKKTE
ncbi:MAG: 30S ribosomal protein S4 [Candidatus Parvarchaeota archaeon]|jgi:small subunit ribosomal protein S4|nr:30S ribosomal protein S4 [Candidatus Parvarchaeota archaeon]MCL5101589.1 30S ribosomal protein S4 [Candidatus Parvarchaeota archaeon]MCL5101666.1 30S ribosomal protein S4 [Candidatus Parvarchaeota archaeon]